MIFGRVLRLLTFLFHFPSSTSPTIAARLPAVSLFRCSTSSSLLVLLSPCAPLLKVFSFLGSCLAALHFGPPVAQVILLPAFVCSEQLCWPL